MAMEEKQTRAQTAAQIRALAARLKRARTGPETLQLAEAISKKVTQLTEPREAASAGEHARGAQEKQASSYQPHCVG
jgi:hypothetical protein